MDNNLKKRAALISLFIGIGMLLIKMGAYLLTGSSAIFSDAAESVVHVLATAMALTSIIVSSKPADKSHLYGHGNIEYFSAGTEGLLIIIAAGVIIYESVSDLIYGVEVQKLDTGIILISVAGFINLFLGFYLIRTGKKTNSLTLIADGKHVLTDSYTSMGVIIGILLVILTGTKVLDPLFAIAVALNILYTGYKLIRESFGGLMNETDPVLLKKITDKFVEIKKDYWIDIHELRFWTSGERIFIDFHLILPYYFTIQQSHAEENDIEENLQSEFPNVQLKIHFDFCVPDLCKYCNYQSCNVRKEEKSRSFDWNVEKLTGRPVYMRD
ncbi:MAG: cation diffusion facilitator family transporter [Ignavibacteriaceae bacterium]